MKKRTLVNLAKLAVSLAIIGYLFGQWYQHRDSFDQLLAQPKNWALLLSAWGLLFASLVLTIGRWFVLVRALDLPFGIRDALRLGFLGYLFNFVSLGSVGGDLFKAVFIAREHPGRKTEAVSTVIVDRLLGLYGLLILGSVMLLLTGQLDGAQRSDNGPARAISADAGGAAPGASQDMKEVQQKKKLLAVVTLALAGGMTFVIGVIMLPGCTHGPVSVFLSGLPRVGHSFRDLLRAARVYRSRKSVLLAMLALTVFQHTLNVLGFYCIAHGLSATAPGLVSHFLIIPLGLICGAFPLPGGGLGVFELAMKKLYEVSAAGTNVELGLYVALVYRVITVLDAMVGAVYYFRQRRELSEVLHEAEEIEEQSEPTVEIRRRK